MLRSLLITIYASLAIATTCSAETYYWVGGTGNWSDTTHWATAPGGNTFYGDLPGAEDDVIFSESSFNGINTVTIDVATASCRNMIWNSAIFFPTLNNLPSSTLILHGDLRLNPQMNFAFTGNLFFRGAGDHTVSSFGQNLGANVYFDDAEGAWQVDNATRLTATLYLRKGSVVFDDVIQCNLLHIIPTALADSCAITLNDNVTIRGSNSGALESMKINVDFVDLTIDPNIQFELSGPTSTLRIVGLTENLSLPSINFSSTTGSQRILADPASVHEFGEIIFEASGRIDRSANIGRLNINGGNTHLLGANQDFEVDDFITVGDCSAPIYLFSTAIGTRARISSDNVQNGTYLYIRDIEVTNGTFQVSNAKNLGNVDGWDMTDQGSQDLYWVGGTGSWQDQNNWSYTSGGAGGACIPSPIDDVYFDDNSFDAASQVVTLDGSFSYCQSMTWSDVQGTPSFVFGGKSLNVSGSLTLVPGLIFTPNGILRFDAFQGNYTITSAGHDLGRDVRIEARGGAYELLDDLTIRGRLLHVYGSLVTNGNTLNLVEYASNYTTPRTLDISNTEVNIAAIPGKRAAWHIGSSGYTLTADNSTINVASAITLVHRGTGVLQFDNVLFNSTGNVYAYNGVDVRFRYASMASSSFILANHQFDTLALAPSQSYEFSSRSVQTFGRLESIGSCTGPINIQAQTVGIEAIFYTDLDNSEVRNTQVKDIHVRGAGAINNVQGVDNGNTDGWSIVEDGARDLYWVGNAGSWNDAAHWSLTSQGSGGECIPTSIDNVFFDEHSFTQASQVVTGGNIFFKNMSWAGVTNTPAVSFGKAFTYGSIELSDDMNINTWSWISLYGQTENNILDTKGKQFTHLDLNGLGGWSLASPINAKGQFFIYNGGLATNGHDIRTERIRIWERNNLNIDLSSSNINLFGDGASVPQFAQYQVDAAVLNFDPGTSTINIEHPNGYTLIGSNEVSLHNLNFLSPTGRGFIDVRTTDRIEYHKVEFNSDGLILREHMIDSLIFTPGKTYTLHSGRTQIVNDHLEIMGSPCGETTLKASTIGAPSTIQKTNGSIAGDYLNMRDQIGDDFNAGQHSKNIGNSNTGWVFEQITEDNPERGILGADHILCDDTSVVLNSLSSTQDLTYSWNTGAIGMDEEVSSPGIYWVDLTFADGCELRDSIELLPQIYANTDLGTDTTLCIGEELILDATIEGGVYLWQDNTVSETYPVTTAGQYHVEVEYEGCLNTDSINVSFDVPPVPNLGMDKIACVDEVVQLTPNIAYDDIVWNDDPISTEDTLSVVETGSYVVEVTKGTCAARDSVEISYFDLEGYLGADTSMCLGENVRLEYMGEPTVSYEWSNGNNGPFIVVDSVGVYSLQLTMGECQVSDDITVSEKPMPTLFIDKEMTVCEGESILLSPISNGDTFSWSTEETSKDIAVTEEGTYQVSAFLNGCVNNDYTTVFVDERPDFDLGRDTIFCKQEPISVNVFFSGASYAWSDGFEMPSRIISETGNYAVTVTSGVCEIEAEINAVANECKEFQIYTPNIFTPNGDGKNDEFLPYFDQSLEILTYQLVIYDRWGSLVFKTTNPDNGWNGSTNGKQLHRGNYIYTMEIAYKDELKTDEATVSGDVFLMR